MGQEKSTKKEHPAKGKPQRKYTISEREEICDNIFEAYGSDTVTIESVCKAYGIDYTNFKEWINNTPKLQQKYKDAKNKQNIVYKDRIRRKALNSLERGVEGYSYTKSIKKFKPNDYGEDKLVEETKEIVKVLPVPNLIMYALNNTNTTGDTLIFRHRDAADDTAQKTEEKVENALENVSTELLEKLASELKGNE